MRSDSFRSPRQRCRLKHTGSHRAVEDDWATLLCHPNDDPPTHIGSLNRPGLGARKPMQRVQHALLRLLRAFPFPFTLSPGRQPPGKLAEKSVKGSERSHAFRMILRRIQPSVIPSVVSYPLAFASFLPHFFSAPSTLPDPSKKRGVSCH